MRSDCNRCNTPCREVMHDSKTCKEFTPPKEGWPLAELALAYPTSLNEALSYLPFNVHLNFYLRQRR